MKDGFTKNVEMMERLRMLFPHGHPDFLGRMLGLMDLHSRKNKDYAGGGNPLGNFYRRARILDMYPGLDLGDPAVIPLVDMLKQLDAALWLVSQGNEAEVEGPEERLRDIAVYAVIAQILLGEAEGDETLSDPAAGPALVMKVWRDAFAEAEGNEGLG